MNKILASLTVLPKLVSGKVCVLNGNSTYSLYNPSKYTTIEDDFDPMDYSLLISAVYAKCIVRSTPSERNDYLVNQQYQKHIQRTHQDARVVNVTKPLKLYGKGDKIHIHSRRGVYELLAYDHHTITITCNKWKYEPNPSDHLRVLPASDFKCIAGGLHNYSE